MAQVSSSTNARWNPSKTAGSIRLVYDTAANDIDKTLTVPTDYVWEVQHVYCSWTSDATVGNRQVVLQVRDDADTVIAAYPAAAVQAASGTETYTWGGTHELTETVATYHHLPLMPKILPSGYDIRVYDSAAIAATDDMTVYALVIEYPA